MKLWINCVIWLLGRAWEHQPISTKFTRIIWFWRIKYYEIEKNVQIGLLFEANPPFCLSKYYPKRASKIRIFFINFHSGRCRLGYLSAILARKMPSIYLKWFIKFWRNFCPNRQFSVLWRLIRLFFKRNVNTLIFLVGILIKLCVFCYQISVKFNSNI